MDNTVTDDRPDASVMLLTLNAGSSSIKFALFDVSSRAPSAVSRGQVDGIGEAPHFVAKDAAGRILQERHWPAGASETHETLLGNLLDWVDARIGDGVLMGVGHRVVHGGPHYDKPMTVTPDVLSALDRLTPMAPLHQPHNLSPIRAVAALRPGLPQVVCFDTAFHHGMPAVAARIALPPEFAADGIRRYGFHGLSYEYIAGRLRTIAPHLAGGRVIVAHLGNGASLCALREGRSIDTTMGFTALDGLVMGTRCGDIDPGVVLYLQQAHGLSASEVEDLLYHRSGLLGISGLSGDMRTLLDHAGTEPRAREAIELFVYRLAREAGGLASSLGGLDGLVFTAGIGEHAPEIRAASCAALAWLGVALDPDANARHADVISTAGSRVEVRVIPTDEELMIARHTLETLPASSVGI